MAATLSPLLFAIVVDVITANARGDRVNEIRHADDLAIISETMKDLKKIN